MDVTEAKEAVYESLAQDNMDIDLHIANLKQALKDAGEKEATFEPDRLAQNNRAGRKMMQAYFKKRGVSVTFSQ